MTTATVNGITYRDARMSVPGRRSVLLTSEHNADTGALVLYAWVGIPLTDRSYLLGRTFYGYTYREAVREFRDLYAEHVAEYEREESV